MFDFIDALFDLSKVFDAVEDIKKQKRQGVISFFLFLSVCAIALWLLLSRDYYAVQHYVALTIAVSVTALLFTVVLLMVLYRKELLVHWIPFSFVLLVVLLIMVFSALLLHVNKWLAFIT